MDSKISSSQEKAHFHSLLHPQEFWEQITLPHSSIKEPERRRRVRLLSNLLMVLFLAAIAAVVIDWLAKGFPFNTFWLLIDVAIFALAYRLSRTKYYRIAIALTVITITVSILYAANLNQKAEDLNFLMLVALFGSLFLSPHQMILTSVATVVTILLFPIVNPVFSFREILEEVFLVALTGVISTVAASVQLADMRYIEKQSRELSDHVKRLIQGREALLRSEARLSNILDHAADAIISVDTDQNIILFNKAAENIFGYRLSEVLGQPVEILLPSSRVLSNLQFTDDVRIKHQSTNNPIQSRHEVVGKRKDSTEFPALLSVSKLVENSQIIFTAILSDITEQKQAQAEILSLSKFPAENPNPIFRVTWEGRILYANNASMGLLQGWKREVGENLPERWQQAVRQAIKAGITMQVEVESLDKIFACILSPIQSTGYINLYCLDITARKQAEERLRRSEEQYRTLFNGIPAALYRSAPDGQILDANPALVDLLGYPDYETLSKVNVCDMYVQPEERDRENTMLLRDGVVRGFEFIVRRFDGQVIRVRDSSHIVMDAKSNLLYYEGSLEDITAQKRLQETLQKSEQTYRALFEHANDAIFLLNLEGVHIAVNQKAADMLGYRKNELIGMTVRDTVAFHEYSDANNKLQHLLAGRPLAIYERTFRRKNGAEFPVEINVSLVRDTEDKPLYIQSIVRDITERKHAEETLHKSREMYRNLFENNPHPMWVYDVATLAFLMVNDAAIQHYGYTKEEFLRMSIMDIRPKDDLPLLISNLAKETLPLEKSLGWRHLRSDGSVIDVEITSHAIQFDGREARLVLVDDVTERKRFENELRALNAELEERVANRTQELSNANAELERANRAKDEFLATMSHELRTPLNSIMGLSESLLEQRRDLLTERQHRSLQVIESSGRHLLELINDILDLSKIEAGKLDYYPETIKVDEICHSSLAFVKSQAAKKSINLIYHNETSAVEIYADPRRLKQILVNLLTNAVKFTYNQGYVTLDVRATLEQDYVQFSVSDSGIGIAKEDLQRLFQPFVQVDSRLNRQFEGTGLGLALVQKLTDLHGGSVHVESEVGKGSRFSINLPWGTAIISGQNALQSSKDLLTRKDLTGSMVALNGQGNSKTVLLAEDNMANILTIGEYLEAHDLKIVSAHNGMEAIEKSKESNPDIILMDIQMPVLDGLEAIRQLRLDPQFKTTPIIALTALAMPGDRERCIEAGANEYMSKPVSLKKLLHVIWELAEGVV